MSISTSPTQKMRATIRSALTPVATQLGLYISGIEFAQDHRGLVIRLYLDGPNGVGIAQCAKFSRESSPILDVEDPIEGQYVLEVSSPGFNRLIELPADFLRFQGFHIRVKLVNRKKKIDGILISSSKDGFTMQTDIEQRTITFDQLSSVRLHPTAEEIKRLPTLKPVNIDSDPSTGEQT